MFLRILKKDLKRKKTMNIILLIFVTLSAMFMSSSVNNIISVATGIDYYFEKAGLKDYFYISRYNDGTNYAEERLKSISSYKEYKKEDSVMFTSDDLSHGGKKLIDSSRSSLLMPVDNAQIKYFDSENNEITSVPEGKAYITTMLPNDAGLREGDRICVDILGTKIEFEYIGKAKDAFLGSGFVNNPRILINRSDYDKFLENKQIYDSKRAAVFYIQTDDTASLQEDMSGISGIYFEGDIGMIKTTYIMDTLVAAIFLVVSFGLIIVSLVVLRFTIGFTITEEFREIGVMKALGLPNGDIRRLYLIKYAGIAAAGSLTGFILGIPFGNMMIKQSEKNMVLDRENIVPIGLACSALVVVIILVFCYRSTAKIKKLSPIDAVRDGQTGERFSKGSKLVLGKSRLGLRGFLGANDILSAPRHYGIITLVFTICILLVMILATTANTLKSDSLIYLFGVTESDVFLSDTATVFDVMAGVKTSEEADTEIEDILRENGMPASVHHELWYRLPVITDKRETTVVFLKCSKTKTTDYTYTEGTAPAAKDEIAVTDSIAEEIGADIGDKVKININGNIREYMITAKFESMNNLGKAARLHEDVEIPDSLISSSFHAQIDFDDHPDDDEIAKRIEKIKDIFDTSEVFDKGGFVDDCTGVGSTIADVKNLVLIISIMIIIMISILMERSFITKEKPQIALLKAIGFENRDIYIYHTVRFALTVAAAAIIAALVCIPMTKLTMDPIFRIMGATKSIKYELKYAEIFGFYQVIIICSTIIAAFMTSLYTVKIKAQDTASIE